VVRKQLQLQLQQQALKEEAKAEAEKLREMQQIEQEYIQLEAKLAQEAQQKQEEEAQFNAMVQDMIAQAEQDMIDVHAMLNVPPPKRQDFDTFWKFVLAWKQHLIYEVKWRAKDIYYEYSITMPYPPGYTPPTPLRKLSLEQHLGLLRDSVRLTFEDIRYQLGRGPPPILLRGVEAHREWMENDRLRRQEMEEEEAEEEETSDASGVVTTTQTVKKKKRKKSLNRTIVQTFKESSSGNEFVSNLIQSRLMLVRNVMNQFIVGYNEGMGREIDRDALLRRKQAYAEPIRMNKEAVIEKVGTVASTLRKFTDDVKGMTEVSEADLDLANVGSTTIDQQQQAETPSTNKNKATSGKSSTRKSTTSSK